MIRNQRRKCFILLLIILILAITIGYAALTTSLTISGTSGIHNASWDIHFDHIQETTGSVIPNSTTSINAAGDTVTYNITLTTPGDFYEFTVDAVNAGSIDGMIESVTSKLNGSVITTLPTYLDYSVTYSDGMPISNNHLLAANSSETYKVRVEYKREVNPEDLPTSNQTLSFSFSVNYIQANNNAVAPTHPVSFLDDSWDTIIGVIQSGNTNAYHVGDTKTVNLENGLGTHTLRIVNKSTPSECSTVGFSQTACGFVLEFADVIITHVMNPSEKYQGVTYQYGWNVDGWPVSSMRTYVNNDIYNALPEVLRNAIINTMVVSGHGSTVGEANFTSTDKLYLLSTHEVWEDVDGNTSGGIDYYDTAYNNTRQLDYYVDLGVTMGAYNSSTSSWDGNYSSAFKQRNGTNLWWLLRSAHSINASHFAGVDDYGGWGATGAGNTRGVSPAFRIG